MKEINYKTQLEDIIIQLKLPLEVETIIDPSDPVVTFKEVMSEQN